MGALGDIKQTVSVHGSQFTVEKREARKASQEVEKP